MRRPISRLRRRASAGPAHPAPLGRFAPQGFLARFTPLTLLILLIAFVAVAVFSLSCRSVAVGPGAAAIEAETLWLNGDDAGAAAAFEEQVEGGGGDHALFRLALVYGSPASAVHDPARSAALLRRLIEEHPTSPYRAEAAAVLALEVELERLRREASSGDRETRRLRGYAAELQGRIDTLTGQLEELKRIDLERRRQPP